MQHYGPSLYSWSCAAVIGLVTWVEKTHNDPIGIKWFIEHEGRYHHDIVTTGFTQRVTTLLRSVDPASVPEQPNFNGPPVPYPDMREITDKAAAFEAIARWHAGAYDSIVVHIDRQLRSQQTSQCSDNARQELARQIAFAYLVGYLIDMEHEEDAQSALKYCLSLPDMTAYWLDWQLEGLHGWIGYLPDSDIAPYVRQPLPHEELPRPNLRA